MTIFFYIVFSYKKIKLSNLFLMPNTFRMQKMNRIKEVLKDQGRTQTWLAERIDKSYVIVTNYCNNNAQPSIEVLRKIAAVLDVDVRVLLEPTKR